MIVGGDVVMVVSTRTLYDVLGVSEKILGKKDKSGKQKIQEVLGFRVEPVEENKFVKGFKASRDYLDELERKGILIKIDK